MSEERANYLLLWALSVQFPFMGLGALFLAAVMARNTTERTRLGTSLVVLFALVGLFMLALGGLFVRALAIREGWPAGPSELGWIFRGATALFGVAASLAALATGRAMLRVLRAGAGDGTTDDGR
jgi:Na+/melibiose symporter-like transporter